jgi:hypothetical protein
MGPTLEETRRDLRYMPTQYLTQVAQSPNDRVIGDIPLKTLAGLELSRRAQMQNELAARGAANPQMPTVLDSTVQTLSPQPQQPMPQQGMMPPQQPMPQQAAPQPQPQQPPQPQQQQQPPQAKQPPIMGLPAMQGPKKMAGGGIIAFAGPEGSEVPKDEEATSALGDMLRSFLRGPEKDGRNAREVEWEAAKTNPSTWFNLATAMTPSQRKAASEKAAALRREAESIRGTSVSPAVEEDAKKNEGNPAIIKAPDRASGLADLARMAGGMGGGGGFGGRGSGGGELSAAAKRLADFSERETPEQQAYRASALKRAQEFENYKSPAMSEAQREALEEKQYGKYQARSKPHFDMMQKLIDEEKAANNAGKESEFYQMLGKMGGALMSSRGAFGPALGRAVGEGIDYADKADAARAAAERLRRQAQMDLLKARMADEKGDQKSAQDYINEHDRNMRDAARLELDAKKASTEMLKDVAGADTKRQIEGAKLSNAFDIASMRNQHALEKAGLTSQMGLMNLALRMKGMEDKNLPTISDVAKAEELADRKFMDFKRSPEAMKYISSMEELGGDNLLKAVNMGTMKPDNPKFLAAVEAAKKAYIKDLLKGTRTSGGGSGVTMGTDYLSSIGG